MTVFLAHAPADRAAAEALEAVIERRGQFVELDDGQIALRPVQRGDVLVLLVSQALMFATARLRLEQRALDAWTQGRLVLVKLDTVAGPVGLRDLSMIDASVEALRESQWNEVADAIRERLVAAPMSGAEEAVDAKKGAAACAAAPAPLARGWLIGPLLAMPGLMALAATLSIWLANRIGATPGGWPELRAGIDHFGTRYGLAPGVTEWLFLAAILVTFGVIATAAVSAFRVAQRRAAAPSAAKHTRGSGEIFVAYARADESAVAPVLESAMQAGCKFARDDQRLLSGDSGAREIASAIGAAAIVIVMCSKAAFESDHVKREIYLADRCHKRLVPVFIEAAEAPEDIEYFFAGVKSLNLFETPEAERPQAFARALG